MRTARRIHKQLQQAANNSRAISLSRVGQSQDEAPDRNDAATAADADPTAQEDTPPSPQTVTESAPRRRNNADGAVQASAVYRLYDRARQVGTESWLYRWLTKEPEPEVIVIDLRETWTAGPILARIDETLRDLLPATVSSTVVRSGYRVRDRVTERPIRILSIAMIVLVILAITILAVGDASIGPEWFVLLGVLLLAIRGTQSTRSWGEIAQMRWYQWIRKAFEPP